MNWMVRIGNFVEESISKGIYDLGQEAPILVGEPLEKVWYSLPVPEGMCADGSDYHIYVKKGTTDKLCIFFSGGGIAINEYMAARPVNGGRVAAWLPNYYWNNLRLFTQVMNINVGITVNGYDNPFDDWNFVIITYATGDMHVGDSRMTYRIADDGGDEEIFGESGAGKSEDKGQNMQAAGQDERREAVLHFHGYQNFMAAMRAGKKLFPTAEKLLIAGESAGAFAVPALAEQIVGEFYPACHDVTLFSDSAQLVYKGWKRTLKEVWQTRRELWAGINGTNLAQEWYKGVCRRQGKRFRYLYSGSTTDYLLSAFYNDVTNKVYDTDTQVQEIYYAQMQKMIRELRSYDPDFSFYIHDWHRPLSMYKGGSIHTVVRQPEFLLRTQDDVTMAYWLSECVEGRTFNVGMSLLR